MSADQSPVEEPLDLLLACHERIRRVTAGVRALAELEDPHDPRARPTAEQAARYLRTALALHAQDEDDSLAPRLRALSLDDETLAALARMEDEHQDIERGAPAVVTALEAFLTSPEAGLPGLKPAADWLERVLLPHIDREEVDIFPACDQLGRADRAAILTELRRRRNA